MVAEGVKEATPSKSWEAADLEETMKNLSPPSQIEPREKSTASTNDNGDGLARNMNKVDQFLLDALQNPRDRLTILRMEQRVEKFIQNPSQQELEFEQLPTSYLRLVAHRVAQHHCLQSIVVGDFNSANGSGSRIIARKTSDSRYPVIRLADIPVNLPQDENTNAVKFEIKQRMQQGSLIGDRHSLNVDSSKLNFAKSVEERKEEYSKARARIFNGNNIGDLGGTSFDEDFAAFDEQKDCSVGASKAEVKHTDRLQNNDTKGFSDYSSGTDRTNNLNGVTDPVGRVKSNNGRVAIFRDHEKDRNDPDYDRSYDRYGQRFDPGFGLNMGVLSMQAMYAPLVNYNSEFPQMGAPHRAQIHMEPQSHAVLQHVHSPWIASPNTMGYGPLDTLMRPLNPSHMGAGSAAAMYLQASQFACPGPGLTYAHHHERFQQSIAHPHLQQLPELSFGQALRR